MHLQAVAICSLPTHYFFQFLYYTDVAALLMLALCYQVRAARRWSFIPVVPHCTSAPLYQCFIAPVLPLCTCAR
jgi:hypothetical protein